MLIDKVVLIMLIWLLLLIVVVCCWLFVVVCCWLLFVVVCLLFVVCFVCFVFVFVFLSASPTCKSKAACKFWERYIKNELLQLRDGHHLTQDEKCYTEMCLTSRRVPRKCRLRPKHFAFRILVPMSYLKFVRSEMCRSKVTQQENPSKINQIQKKSITSK